MVKYWRYSGLILGILALIGSFSLIFHLHYVTAPLSQGPARNIVLIWELPYSPLGIFIFWIGIVLLFICLPKNVRLLVLGVLFSIISLALASAFRFNDYHSWWWRTFPFTLFFGIGSALCGGFLIGRNVKGPQKIPRWVHFLIWLLLVVGAYLIAHLIVGAGLNESAYYDYSGIPGPYPCYVTYAGDYSYKPLAIEAFQIFTIAGLYFSFSIGFLIRRKPNSQPSNQSSTEASI